MNKVTKIVEAEMTFLWECQIFNQKWGPTTPRPYKSQLCGMGSKQFIISADCMDLCPQPIHIMKHFGRKAMTVAGE